LHTSSPKPYKTLFRSNHVDLNVVVNVLNGPVLLYRNDCPAPRIAVQLKGNASNTHGIGAKIKVIGGPVTQTQEMISGGRYLSCEIGRAQVCTLVTWAS